jgi:hypothetical protein
VTIKLSTCEVQVSETTTLDTIRINCPTFFKTPHGKRETYSMYRGFLIVRNTVRYSNISERRTAIYLYTNDLEGSPGTLCVSGGQDLKTIKQTKKLVDRIITTGAYSYGM